MKGANGQKRQQERRCEESVYEKTNRDGLRMEGKL